MQLPHSATLRFCLVIACSLLLIDGRWHPVPAKAAQTNTVAVVSAASYEATALAPGAIAAAFGVQLATRTEVAASVPLPTNLAGTSVRLKDSAGTERLAQLFFVSSGQINFAIPAETAAGAATISVVSGDGTQSQGTLEIKALAPAIFTANADGRGVPAAVALRVKANTELVYESVSEPEGQTGRLRPRPLDLSPAGDRVFLILFYSGTLRAADANNDGNRNESVKVLLGGLTITPDYAGSQGDNVGLDQINLELPRSLIGSGRISMTVTAGGLGSNAVEIDLAAPSGNAAPTVSGFNNAPALAGQMIEIQGNGFSSTAAENVVRIGGIEAQVTNATTGKLTALVPTGAETGAVTVRTAQGEGRSSETLRVRTSMSGLVKNTQGVPLKDVSIRVVRNNASVNTGLAGSFVFPEPQLTPLLGVIFQVDASNLPATPAFDKPRLFLNVTENRDNPYGPEIKLQQSYGTSTQVGGQGLRAGKEIEFSVAAFAPDETAQIPTQIQTGEISLSFPAETRFTFPDGASSGTLTLTQVEKSRTPVSLPVGLFSSTIVQITPFGTRFAPGGRLVFPNADGFPANATVRLYRLDQTNDSTTIGRFVDSGSATVSADGKQITTETGVVIEATQYFVAQPRNTTSVIGRVLDSDGTPVRRAQVSVRGQETQTDGTGGFLIRNVPVSGSNDLITAEASFVRPTLRVENVESKATPAVSGGVTDVGTLMLPSATSNQPPYVVIPSDLTIIAGTTRDIVFIAGDPDSDQAVQVSFSGPGFARLQTDNRTIRVAPTANDIGQHVITLTVTDVRGAGAAAVFRLNVVRGSNQTPVLTVPGPQAVLSEQTLNFTVEATDPDSGQTLTYAASNLPSGATFTPATRQFSWTPTRTQAGNYTVTFTATDNGQPPLSDSQTVNITVTNANRPPVANAQSVTTDEDIAKAITLAATDADDDGLTYSIVTQPARGALSGTPPNVVYTPNKDFNGTDSFTFKANDGKGDSNTATVSLIINPINDAPVLTAPGAQTVSEGQALSFAVSATDVDSGQTVTLSASNLPSGANFNPANGQFTWTPGFNQSGNYTVNFTATDNGSPALSDTKAVAISVSNVNRQPVANAQTVTTNEDIAVNVTLNGSDPDGDTITYALVTRPTRGTLSGTPPNVIYTPNKDFNGADSFTFKVNDGQTDSNTATVTLNINPVNDAPVLTVPGAQTVNEGQALNFTVSATDVDSGQTATLSAGNLPSGASFIAATGQFTWTPNSQQAGNYTVNFTATDNGSPVLSDTKAVAISVGNVNRPPVANALTVTTNEDAAVNLTLTGSDPDGDAISYVIVTAPTRGSLSGTGATRTYTPAPNANGTDSFTFRVNDGTLDSQPATVAINVISVNDPPVLAVPGTQSVNSGQTLSFTVAATDVDAGQTLTYSAANLPSGASFNAATRQFSWTPVAAQAGNYTVSFTVADNGAPVLSDTKTVAITVNAVQGTVRGTVRNASNAALLAGVTISLANTNLSTTSASDGTYVLNNVPQGTYTLNATATGFAATQVSISVVTGQTLTQNLSLSPALAEGQLRITLNWTKDAAGTPDDLDAHLYGPNGNNECFHVFFDNKGSLTAAPFAALEVDNIELAGHPPTETVRLTQFRQGTYRFFVHNYGAEQADGLGRARATVQIFGSAGLLRTYTAPTGTGAFWNVFEINGQTGAITDLNQLASAAPSLTCGTQCTYSITPTSQSFNSGGGTGTVNVTTSAGCTRTATSNASWISITSGATGTGSGAVTYSVQANTTNQARAGTLTIAGQTFTVTQAGATTLTIVDQRLTNVGPTSCTAPTNRTAFFTTDAEVWHWIRVRTTVQGDVFRWDFVQPNGSVYESKSFTPNFAGEICIWNGISLANTAAANFPGNWQVRFYYRNALLTTTNFTVTRPIIVNRAPRP